MRICLTVKSFLHFVQLMGWTRKRVDRRGLYQTADIFALWVFSELGGGVSWPADCKYTLMGHRTLSVFQL